MKVKNYSNKKELFFILIFLSLINISFGSLAFDFPYAFKLKSYKIFVIHKKGISITDEDFTTVERRERTFVGSERITTDEDYAKITHAMEEGEHIVCIIKDKIFVFDYLGNFLNQTSTTITIAQVEYYDLTITKEEGSYTLFTIGYIFENKYNFLRYYYYYSNKNIELLQSHIQTGDKKNYLMANSALSCKYLYYMLGFGSQLVCLYYAEGKGVGLQKYEKIDQSQNANKLQIENQLYFPTEERVIYIRTTYIDDYNILIGWITESGVPYYTQYNIKSNDEKLDLSQYKFNYIKCQLKPQFFKFNLYTARNDKKEALYTCIMERNTYPTNPYADILVGYFSSFTKGLGRNYYKYTTNNNYKYENCTMHGYSLVYFENVKDYYIISDAICNGKQMPINRLISELSEDEKLPPETEAPVSDDLLYDSCDKCPDNLCELDLTCSKSGDCKEQSYFGDKCNKLCEEISPYCKICSREGMALIKTILDHHVMNYAINVQEELVIFMENA